MIQFNKNILQQAPTYLYKRIIDQFSILETSSQPAATTSKRLGRKLVEH